MEPLFVLFWSIVACQLSFLTAYAWLGWHRGAAVAVLSSFVALGVGLLVPGGLVVALAYVATLAIVGMGAGRNTMAALVIATTALAVTAYANASHTPDGFFALIALFVSVGAALGADLWRTKRNLPVWV